MTGVLKKKKVRFKNKDFDTLYWRWVSMNPENVKDVLQPGSNRDQAFRDGYVGHRCKYQRNWILYPIYVAGKEWKKVNNKQKIQYAKETNLGR